MGLFFSRIFLGFLGGVGTLSTRALMEKVSNTALYIREGNGVRSREARETEGKDEERSMGKKRGGQRE